MSLKDFLVGMATDAAMKQRYAEDPEGTMAAAGLTAEERAAFASGDSMAVRTALGRPDNDCMSQTGQSVPAGSMVKRPKLPDIPVKEDSFLISKKDCDVLLGKGKGRKRAVKKTSGKAQRNGTVRRRRARK